MRWLTDPFAYDFVRAGLAASLLTVVMTSVTGTWVVLRGMSFIGDGLAHGALPGIAIAHLAGVNLSVGAMLSALAMVAGIELVHRRARLAEDVAIALLFVGMLALGVTIISRSATFAGDLTAFLFGSDPVSVTGGDLLLALGGLVVVVVACAALYRSFLVLTFSQVKSETLGLAPRLTHAVLLTLIAVAIVTSFRIVGTLLVFAFLIAPPATAALFARRVPVMMAAAIGFGTVAVVVGLLVSFHLGTATAPTIAGLTVVQFFAVLLLRDALAARHGARTTAGAALTGS